MRRRRERSISGPRRAFLKRSLLGGAALWIGQRARAWQSAAGRTAPVPLAPPPALRVLTEAEARTLAAVGDCLVPGSAAAGLVAYVDVQLAAPPGRSMLMGKYVGVTAPLEFYRSGLAAVDAAARRDSGREIDALDPDQIRALVGRVAAGSIADWQGPPSGLLYFVLRADAIDVTYGTPGGFAKLGIPYMAHIEPPDGWIR